ncbi:MAG: DUF1016 N-terminal domain-containing protein [Bacteroidota bacterium]
MKDLNNLAEIIAETHEVFQSAAVRSVNKYLTIRNWMIGYYIVEYEQHGEDRATYGANLVKNLSKQINKKGLGFTNLKLSRQFYQNYSFLEAEIKNDLQLFLPAEKSQLPTDLLLKSDYQEEGISQTPSDQLEKINEIRQSVTDELQPDYIKELINSVSFTHFVELLKIEDATKRRFYEMMIIKAK